MWTYRGQARPPFAVTPRPGQESVWDYPRPPRIVTDSRRVEVRHGDLLIGGSTKSLRVLETASPPTFYLPPQDVRTEHLRRTGTESMCEWKGLARYWCLATDSDSRPPVAWCYPAPTPAFASLAGYFAFYPSALECFVNGERVQAQPGQFYGGWVTAEIAGPFKGEPGSSHW